MTRALVNKLKEDKIYFPKYSGMVDLVENGKFDFTISTLIRIQSKDGKWYIAPFTKFFKNIDGFCLSDKFQIQFLNEAYRFLVNGLVPDNIESLMTVEGYPLFELDELQISEQERMKNI